MTFETHLLYLGAVAAFFATPPDTSQLLAISNSARHGLGRASFTVMGDLSANVAQMTAAAFGLATIVAQSAKAFAAIKWLGVAYLAWIGLRRAPGRLFRQGFVTSMANPFAVVFFAALFPQFIDQSAPILPQLLILGATYLVVDGAILALWGYLGMRAARGLERFSFTLVNKICGGLMIAAAALLASKDFEPQR